MMHVELKFMCCALLQIVFFTFFPTFIWLFAGVHNGKLPL
jgi:hypothetical protein